MNQMEKRISEYRQTERRSAKKWLFVFDSSIPTTTVLSDKDSRNRFELCVRNDTLQKGFDCYDHRMTQSVHSCNNDTPICTPTGMTQP